MAEIPITEMSERTRDIFRLVVENYLGTGAPVGSRTISRLPGLNLIWAAYFRRRNDAGRGAFGGRAPRD